MSLITPETVKQVAQLARLQLDGEALRNTALQLDEILQYVQKLQAVPTDSIEPTSHVLPLSDVLRSDELKAPLGQQAVLALAPAKHPPFIKVPKVIE